MDFGKFLISFFLLEALLLSCPIHIQVSERGQMKKIPDENLG
jgi:hypothetical protein